MKNWTGIVLCAGILAGCTTSADTRVLFDGQFFNANLRKVDRQLDVFTVTVKGVSKSLEGALAAGEFEAIQHCVNLFGSSEIIWAVGPETPQEQLNIVRDTLVMQGRCHSAR